MVIFFTSGKVLRFNKTSLTPNSTTWLEYSSTTSGVFKGELGLIKRVWFALAMSVMLSSLAFASGSTWSEVLKKHEDYVRTLRHDPGFLTNTPLGIIINPYFNNIALWGMAANPDNKTMIEDGLIGILLI